MSLEILRFLTESVDGAVGASRGQGRYSRRPDYSAPSARSTRPRSDRGVTFHFQHKTISKRNDVSQSAKNMTSAAPHQAYIERPSATDRTEGFNWGAIGVGSGSRADWIPENPPGSPDFLAPEIHVDRPKASFGTIGSTKAKRQDFWREVEAAEGRNGRVQCRIISELPHELDQGSRIRISRDFCRIFEENGLPYWASIHSPTGSNDRRNHHLHICYHDRPSAVLKDGRWDFSITEEHRKKSRHRLVRRPWRRHKSPLTRDRSWVKSLRHRYAEVCNFYLGASGLTKRYDPRSYRDSGITKTPTVHMGFKSSALESFGLETVRGLRNARREIAWRFERDLSPWVRREALLQKKPDEECEKLIHSGRRETQRATAHEIAADILMLRTDRRRRFLKREAARVTSIPDQSRLSDTATTASLLDTERSIIEVNFPEISRLAKRCREVAAAARNKAARLLARLDLRLSELGISSDQNTATSQRAGPESDTHILPEENRAKAVSGGSELPQTRGRKVDESHPTDEAEIGPPLSAQTSEADLSMAEKETIRALLSKDLPKAQSTPKNLDERSPGPRPRSQDHDPILEAIRSLSKEEDTRLGPAHREGWHGSIESFPGAFAIAKPSSTDDIRALDQKLIAMNNLEVRYAAIVTRDATDFCAPGELKTDLKRGWVVLRAEAERRGIDLDTGLQDIRRATDKERAELHRDQEFLPMTELRKQLERDRLR